MKIRNETKKVCIGRVQVGGQHKIVIQTMAKNRAKHIKEALKELNTYATEGAEMIRFSVLDDADALAFKTLKAQTDVPLIADIHYNHRLALMAIEAGVDKIRINPGNINDQEKVKAIVEKAKAYQIPIRLGINLGSLEKNAEKAYGKTAKAMVESAKTYVEFFESLDFHDIVISLKASDVATTIEAYSLAAEIFDYPLHLGITEAGPTYQGTIKSAAALGALIYQGIGDTIRISLSGDRLDELKACKTLLASFDLYKHPILISCPTCGRLAYEMGPIITEIEQYLENHPTNLKVAIMGCSVNGPGEAQDADIGIAGGKNEALLFIKGKIVKKIKEDEIIKTLIDAIERYDKS